VALIERGGGGIGVAGASRRDTGIEVYLPTIPLWVPDDARAEIDALTLDTMRLALHYAAGEISGAAPVDSGQLAQSFTADPATQTGGIDLAGVDVVAGVTGRVFSSLPYAIVMDQGRRPGSPISRAGIDAIGLWAQRKLGMSADQADRAKWAIASVIVQRGIEGRQFVHEGIQQSRPTIEGMFQALAESVAAALLTPTGKRRNRHLGNAVRKAGRKVRKGRTS